MFSVLEDSEKDDLQQSNAQETSNASRKFLT